MKRLLRSLLLLLFLCISGTAMAQSNSGISGTVYDEAGEGVISAPVFIYQGGREVTRGYTNDDGQYLIKPLSPGTYQVSTAYNGVTRRVDDVQVGTAEIVNVDIDFRATPTGGGDGQTPNNLNRVIVIGKKPSVIHPDGGSRITGAQIEAMPTPDLGAQLSTRPNLTSTRDGLTSGGGRFNGNTYIVDGIVLAPGSANFTNQPLGSVDQVQALTGGVAARYGDVSGAVIAITTKSSTDRIRGSVTAEHSVEGYGNSRIDWNITGPLFKRRVRDTSGAFVKAPEYDDSGKVIPGTENNPLVVPAVGFVLNGQAVYNPDASPNYDPITTVRPEVLEELRQHPLRQVTTGQGNPYLANAADFVTEDQLMTQKRRPNTAQFIGRMNGKLDYSFNPNISLNANGFFGYNRSHNNPRGNFLFAPENAAIDRSITGRASLRFTQKFENDTSKHGLGLQNAFYTVQADFIRDYTDREDENHGKNTFDYGYIGKFEERFSPVYITSVDPATQKVGTRLVGYQRTGVDFTPSDKNPTAANYTKEFYRLSPFQPVSLQQISNGRGLINGQGPQTVYSLFNNVGAIQGSWQKTRNDQFAIAVDASFDYVQRSGVRHAVEFGLYYQQRSERNYIIVGSALWGLMRQLTQTVVGPSDLDLTSGQYIVGGVTYDDSAIRNNVVLFGPTDTIKYNRVFNSANQGVFDRSLRERFGYDTTDYINIDAIDPSKFSLDMFAPDELFNNGQNLVRYSGYDYMGNLQTGQVNFNDFWTKKDSRGMSTRPIAAFRPNYIAGYLSDFISYKDFKMTLGVRLERYDANTKVLRDPYSLYATYKATPDNGQYNGLNGGVHPANVGSDYVVYVSDGLSKSPSIIGYRNGDDWYDYTGKLLEDPTVLKNYSGGRDPQPFLQRGAGDSLSRITSDAYNVDGAFTDYKPAVNVSPRINFTFPIVTTMVADRLVERAYFFAHYDLLVQRPLGNVAASQVDYLAIQQRGQVQINNPNLRPQKTFDYELGFSSQLTSNSGLTVTAFYKERKDQIQLRPYLYAYPNTYSTYSNRDFSTSKGLTFSYEMQRTGPLYLTLAYTLSFAEGTGSNANSGSALLSNFISAGLPNLRYVTPLDYDSRHSIALNLDFHYVSPDGTNNRGPVLFGKHIFENAGINFIGRVRSGEPYTRYQEAQTQLAGVNVSRTINGGINTSRLPWHYGLDLRVDKGFTLPFGRNKNASLYYKRRNGGLTMNAYVRVENLLNVRDVIQVYGYTGSPSNDGYLTSVSGINTISSQTNPATFVNLYQIIANDPTNFNLPRRINIGLQVYF